MHFHGTAVCLGDNIDTDVIIPGPFLVTMDPAVLGKHCLSGLDPEWAGKRKPGDILVVGSNFGCGSSREHAPLAILGAGVKVVVGASFARIFYRNAFNVGLPLLEIGDAVKDIAEGDALAVDTATGTVRDETTGKTITCEPLPPSIQAILDAGGLEGYVRQRVHAKS